MECKVSELVKRGHDQAAELKASCGAVDVRDVAQLISDLADLYARVMEQADEIAELRRLVIRVPMPVVVPAEIIQGINVKGAFAMGIERYGDAMLKLAKKEKGNG